MTETERVQAPSGGQSASEVVQCHLDRAGLVVAPHELELLTVAWHDMQQSIALIDTPESELFEPADVFSARDRGGDGR